MKSTRFTIFSLYASEDTLLYQELEKHLRPMCQKRSISLQSRHQTFPGASLQQEYINDASLILLLISPDLLVSEQGRQDMDHALQHQQQGHTHIIPILLRPTIWQETPFADFQCLPRNRKPVTEWTNRDAAFHHIALEIRSILEQIGVIARSSSKPTDRVDLLKQVRTRWIDGVLYGLLYHKILIQLVLHEDPGALANPWSQTVGETNLPECPLTPGTHIYEVFESANGQMLILGNPGAGKTTLLLELAKDLLTRACEDDTHGIPVVFNLSSWATNHLPIDEWLIEELDNKYNVSRTIAQTWIFKGEIIPLLDGLDEVAEEQRNACISAINAYYRIYHLVPLVVCCRKSEYNVLPTRVMLNKAVIIQPLTLQAIDEYCERIGKPVAALWQALHQEKNLQELTSTPFMLNILVLTYQETVSIDLLQAPSLKQLQQQIFTRYIERMLTHRRTSASYTKEQTIYYLSWLAKQLQRLALTEFYLDQLQSSWLPTPHLRFIYNAITTLCAGLLVGPLVGLPRGATGMVTCWTISWTDRWATRWTTRMATFRDKRVHYLRDHLLEMGTHTKRCLISAPCWVALWGAIWTLRWATRWNVIRTTYRGTRWNTCRAARRVARRAALRSERIPAL